MKHKLMNRRKVCRREDIQKGIAKGGGGMGETEGRTQPKGRKGRREEGKKERKKDGKKEGYCRVKGRDGGRKGEGGNTPVGSIICRLHDVHLPFPERNCGDLTDARGL